MRQASGSHPCARHSLAKRGMSRLRAQPSFLIGVYAGAIGNKSHPEVLVGGRLRPLLKMWVPDVVVTRIGERKGTGVRELLRQIEKEVGRTPFQRITDSRDRYLGGGQYER